jgi:predicted transcriptional regulator
MERKKNVQLIVRVTEEIARRFEEARAKTGTSIQFVLEKAIKEYIEKRESE